MSPIERLLVLAHAASTLYMLGLIWFVQGVHYPLFGAVGTANAVAYAQRHQSLTTLVVGPPMLIEAATTVALLSLPHFPPWLTWTGLGLLGMIWASTAFLQVPQHSILALGYDASAHQLLVTSNWIRTVGWTLRGGLVLYGLALLLR